jgi:hypothetical protein
VNSLELARISALPVLVCTSLRFLAQQVVSEHRFGGTVVWYDCLV